MNLINGVALITTGTASLCDYRTPGAVISTEPCGVWRITVLQEKPNDFTLSRNDTRSLTRRVVMGPIRSVVLANLGSMTPEQVWSFNGTRNINPSQLPVYTGALRAGEAGLALTTRESVYLETEKYRAVVAADDVPPRMWTVRYMPEW